MWPPIYLVVPPWPFRIIERDHQQLHARAPHWGNTPFEKDLWASSLWISVSDPPPMLPFVSPFVA